MWNFSNITPSTIKIRSWLIVIWASIVPPIDLKHHFTKKAFIRIIIVSLEIEDHLNDYFVINYECDYSNNYPND